MMLQQKYRKVVIVMLWNRVFGDNLPEIKEWCAEHGYTIKSMVILAVKQFMKDKE